MPCFRQRFRLVSSILNAIMGNATSEYLRVYRGRTPEFLQVDRERNARKSDWHGSARARLGEWIKQEGNDGYSNQPSERKTRIYR
jgi:hypothetical protein